MILDAKRQSETKVGKEIQKIKQKMENMTEKIRMITERIARLEPGLGAGGLPKAELQKSIAKLEEVWEGEVGTLKHELWQTIQAHNHNADLLKHHKDAIDDVQNRMVACTPNPELEQVHQHLLNLDRIIHKELAKENQIDQLMQRLGVLQQQLTPSAGWNTLSPGLLAPFNPAAAQAQATASAAATAAAAAAAGKKTQKKAGKATKSAAASLAHAASLRAEAPEFVPTSGPAAGWEP